MRARILLAVLILAGITGATRADDKAEVKPIDRADLDKRVVVAAYESARLGTKMFNDDKNYEGCFRLYQGTLMALEPMLDHRPKLQATIKQQLNKVKNMKGADGAFELRAALDEIQKEIAPSKEEPKKATMWERLGEEKGVKAFVNKVMNIAVDEPKVMFLRDKKVDRTKLAAAMVALVSANSGGPGKYDAADVKAALGGVKVTDAEYDAHNAIVTEQLKKAMVSDADIAALGKVLEGARKDFVEKK